MKLMQFAAKTAVAAALGAGVLGAGLGVAHADDHWPWPQPPGPGVNVGGPGNPLPPGHNGFPPPGHRWVQENVDNVIPPVWAPPAPRRRRGPPSPRWYGARRRRSGAFSWGPRS